MMHPTSKHGFTIAELLVVVAIATIIIFFGMDNFSTHIKRTRDDRRRSDLEQITNALELYRADNNGQYPDTLADGEFITSIGNCTGSIGNCTHTSWQGTIVSSLVISGYITKLPVDPLNSYAAGVYRYRPVCNEIQSPDVSGREINCLPDRGCCGYWLYATNPEVPGNVIEKISTP